MVASWGTHAPATPPTPDRAARKQTRRRRRGNTGHPRALHNKERSRGRAQTAAESRADPGALGAPYTPTAQGQTRVCVRVVKVAKCAISAPRILMHGSPSFRRALWIKGQNGARDPVRAAAHESFFSLVHSRTHAQVVYSTFRCSGCSATCLSLQRTV